VLHATNLSGTNLAEARFERTVLARPIGLERALGLERAIHRAPSSLDAESARALAGRLPAEFLAAMGGEAGARV
jgi:hypothetical protein